MTDVQAPAGRYPAAVAELPLSARPVDHPRGAVVVVPGAAGWVDAALAAVSAGALALVVSWPDFAPAHDIRRLTRELAVPVVVERALLRTDCAADAAAGRSTGVAGSTPRVVVADASAPRGLVPVVAREAVGWLRVLTGADLAFVDGDGALALWETSTGTPATLSVVATDRPGGGSIRAHALGEVLTEIEVEGDRTRVVTSTARGHVKAPSRFESTARLALRRVLAALVSGEQPADLGELAVDTALIEQMLAGAA